jgi:hypothetical protein
MRHTQKLQKHSTHESLFKAVPFEIAGIVGGSMMLGAGMMSGRGTMFGGGADGFERETFSSLLTCEEKGLAKQVSPERLEHVRQLLGKLQTDSTLDMLENSGLVHHLSKIAQEQTTHLSRFYDPIFRQSTSVTVHQNIEILKKGSLERIRMLRLDGHVSQRAILEDMLSARVSRTSDVSLILSKVPLGDSSYTLDHLFEVDREKTITDVLGERSRVSLHYMLSGYRTEIQKLLISNHMAMYTILDRASEYSNGLLLEQDFFERQHLLPFYDEVITTLEDIQGEERIDIKHRMIDTFDKKLRLRRKEMTRFTEIGRSLTTNLDLQSYYKSVTTIDQNGNASTHRFFDMSKFLQLDPLFREEGISRDALYILPP